jgi:hypothetical protein
MDVAHLPHRAFCATFGQTKVALSPTQMNQNSNEKIRMYGKRLYINLDHHFTIKD